MAAAALPVLTKGLSAIAGALLAQHTKRLQDAASENQALDNLIPAFDADLQAVAQAFNSGTDPQSCISALIAIDTNAYNYLRAQVGKAGTAWGGPSTTSLGTAINPSYSATCNKACTAGCCVYLNDLRPAIFGRSGLGSAYAPFQTSAGVAGGMVGAIQNGGGVVHVIDIAAPPRSAYGNYSRAGYTLTLKAPPKGSGTAAAVLASSGSGTSFTITAEPPTAPTSASTSLTANGVLDSLTKASPLTILTAVGALILIITALFGQRALQVNR